MEATLYGLINKISAAPGKREQLIQLLLQGSDGMAGCLSYIVAADAADPDSVWITEVWSDADKHKASLELPAVKQAIAEAMPMIAGFKAIAKTIPIGGAGLA